MAFAPRIQYVTDVRYCYRVQAWIVNAAVDRCGHRIQVRGCYACTHAREAHPVCGRCTPHSGVRLGGERSW